VAVRIKYWFQAPQFDASGQEGLPMPQVSPASLHNGQLIHENVERRGPTQAAMNIPEAATNPIMPPGRSRRGGVFATSTCGLCAPWRPQWPRPPAHHPKWSAHGRRRQRRTRRQSPRPRRRADSSRFGGKEGSPMRNMLGRSMLWRALSLCGGAGVRRIDCSRPKQAHSTARQAGGQVHPDG